MELSAVLRHAVEKVPFYSRAYNITAADSIERFEILDRSAVVGNEASFLATDVDRSRLLVSRTSGTTGTPMTIWHSEKERSAAALALWRRRRWFGVSSPAQRSCRYYGYRRRQGNDYTMEPVYREGNVIHLNWFDLSPATLGVHYKAIVDHEPVWIQGPPSALGRFATFLLDTGLPMPKSVRLVELTGEAISGADRAVIEAAFPQAGVASYYGSREMWLIAYECPEGSMHSAPESVHFELEEDEVFPEKPFATVILTSHIFVSMPLIRYRMSDRVQLSSGYCACGRGGTILSSVMGRQADFAHTIDGEPVLAHYFQFVIHQLNFEQRKSVLRYQVEQRGHSFIFRLEVGEGWSSSSQTRLRALMADRFPGQDVLVEIGPLEVGGKFRNFLPDLDRR